MALEGNVTLTSVEMLCVHILSIFKPCRAWFLLFVNYLVQYILHLVSCSGMSRQGMNRNSKIMEISESEIIVEELI